MKTLRAVGDSLKFVFQERPQRLAFWYERIGGFIGLTFLAGLFWVVYSTPQTDGPDPNWWQVFIVSAWVLIPTSNYLLLVFNRNEQPLSILTFVITGLMFVFLCIDSIGSEPSHINIDQFKANIGSICFFGYVAFGFLSIITLSTKPLDKELASLFTPMRYR